MPPLSQGPMITQLKKFNSFDTEKKRQGLKKQTHSFKQKDGKEIHGSILNKNKYTTNHATRKKYKDQFFCFQIILD